MSAEQRLLDVIGGHEATGVPAWAIGGWQYFTVDGGRGGYVSDIGVAGMDGQGDWSVLLRGEEPVRIAEGLAGAWGDGQVTWVDARTAPQQLSETVRAQLTAPTVETSADGIVRFTAFYATPPSMAVQRLEVVAPANGPATFTTTPAQQLVPAAAQADALIERITSSYGPSRRRAVAALAATGDPRAAETIVALLSDGSADLRRAAAEALGTLADPATTPALIAALQQEADPGAAIAMSAALGATGGEGARAALLEVAQSHSSELVQNRARYEAARLSPQ